MNTITAIKTTTSKGMTNEVDKWLETLFKCEILPESSIKALCERAKQIFLTEKTPHKQSGTKGLSYFYS